MVVEAVDEHQVAGPGLAQRPLVAGEAHAREVRRQRQPDQAGDPCRAGFGGRLLDEGRRVLHAYEAGDAQPPAQRLRLGACDLLQRRRPADGPIAFA